MLAILVLLFVPTDQITVEVLPSTPQFTVTVEDTKPVEKPIIQQTMMTQQWYLVSEPWCSACPAAKSKFLAKGWSKSNVITIAECKARFGFSVPYVPYEFGDPNWSATKVPVVPVETAATVKMSHSEMVQLHNRLHGGVPWTWPGDLETHLHNTHHAATTKVSTVAIKKPQQVYTTPLSNCPNGKCPTQSNLQYQSRRRR